MEFIIPRDKIKENTVDLGRKIGYFSIGRGKDEAEFSFVRSLQGSNYPRFHLFVRTDKGKNVSFSIHLDQKKPIYEGGAAHSAEYEGPVVEREIERIKSLIYHD